LYQRLYHRCMSREDSLSSRFDYLFEPLDDEESIDDATGGRSRADDRTAPPSTAPVRLAFAAFVLGTLGVVAVLAVLLLQQPKRTTDRVQIPLDPSPLSTSIGGSSQAVPVPPLREVRSRSRPRRRRQSSRCPTNSCPSQRPRPRQVRLRRGQPTRRPQEPPSAWHPKSAHPSPASRREATAAADCSEEGCCDLGT
jgi:hypothetical protein